MKNIFFTIVLLGIQIFTYGQQKFPDDYVGKYRGELHILDVNSTKMKVDMQLEIAKKNDSIFTWIISYLFNGKKDVRNYELTLKNKKYGHYIIDEKNSILIDAYFKHPILTSVFKVKNSNIVSSYKFKKDTIVFDIISFNTEKPFISGNTNQNKEEIPQVESFLVNGRQEAILSKI
ncbi:MAG: hypothetical protein ACWA42_09920 [Lutibacter sp.]